MNIFLFDSELNWRCANLKLIVGFYYYFWVNCISFCACFVFLFVLFLFIFGVKNYDCFMFIFFHIVFFLVKYLILLMFCFIMYWPTDNSDILRLYSTHSCNKNKNARILNFIQNLPRLCDWEVITCMILLFVQTFAACFVYTKYTEISLQVRTYCWYWIITYTEV